MFTKNRLISDDIVVVRRVTTNGKILKSGILCYPRLQVSSAGYHCKVTGPILLQSYGFYVVVLDIFNWLLSPSPWSLLLELAINYL